MHLALWEYCVAAVAGGVAGAVNAVAGGGTLVSFSVLLGIGVPPVTANVTNTVGLVPAYLAGSWGQRSDLRPQLHRAKSLAVTALIGGLAGSVLLVTIPATAFRAVAPFLILTACLLLATEVPLRRRLRPAIPVHATVGTTGGDQIASRSPSSPQWTKPAVVSVLCASIYGGFFGAGLGIMLMAVLAFFSAESLLSVNALKQALSFVINLVAAGFFVIFGHVRWDLIPWMAVAGVIGGLLGSRLARIIKPTYLRWTVVVAGVIVAVVLWATL
jgi:uncharacterized membrane protein YfcA